MDFLAFFDKDGRRITSMVEGIHFTEENKDQVIEDFKQKNQEVVLVQLITEEQQQLLISGDFLFVGGEIIPAPVVEPTEDEKKQAKEERYEASIDEDLISEDNNLAIMETLADLMIRLDELESKKNEG